MAEYARDTFTRTGSPGWGTSEVGGAWTESLTNTLSSTAGTTGRLQFQGTTLASTAHQRLASATAAADVCSAYRFRVDSSMLTANPPGGVNLWSWVRVSGAIASPVGYYGKVNVKGDGSMVLSIGVSASGTPAQLASVSYAAGTATSGSIWVLELQAFASPAKVQARLWLGTGTPPAYGWITSSDETGPTAAGVYAIAADRGTVSPAAAHVLDFTEYFASDIPAPAFTYTASGLGINVTAAPTGGDFTAYAWDWGDGTAAGSGSTASHTYAGAGTYWVLLTGTTRWGAKYQNQQQVTVAAPPPEPPDLVPVVRIAGVNVCDFLYSLDWSLGRDRWIEPLAGLTCTLRLRGIYSAVQGQKVTIAVPNAVSGKPLWSGVIDEVEETHNPVDASDETRLTAMDTASQYARIHVTQTGIFPSAQLPVRLSDLEPWDWVITRSRYGTIPGSRWAQLKKKTQKPDKLQDRTHLDLVNDALAGSIAFGYTARDGAIVYAPWEAPSGLSSTPVLNFDTGLDCPSRVTIDRRTPDGIVNRWNVGSGDNYYELQYRDSVDAYGEKVYSVAEDVLTVAVDFPQQVTRFNQATSPPGTGPCMVQVMGSPSRAVRVEVPVIDWGQKVITAEPLDLATYNGNLYAVMGIRHSLTVGDAWRVEITLDRNPWAIDGRTPP